MCYVSSLLIKIILRILIASIYNISLDGHEFFHAVFLINQ